MLTIKEITREPISTITNISYIIAAWIAIGGAPFTLLEGYLLLTATALAVGSSLFHSRENKTFQRIDEASMYGLLIAILIHNIGLPWLILVALPASIIMGFHHQRFSSSIWVPALGAVNIAAYIALGGAWYIQAIALVFFAASYIGRQTGEGIYKTDGPTLTYDILHGLWHIGTGATILLMIL